VGNRPGSWASSSTQYVQNYFRYMVTGDPTWNALTANVDEVLKLSREKSAADSTPRIRSKRFAGRGGKLILYHGWNDQAISPWNTVAYYKQVRQTMGRRRLNRSRGST